MATSEFYNQQLPDSAVPPGSIATAALSSSEETLSSSGETRYRPAESHERSRALELFYRNRTPKSREALFRWAHRLSHAAPCPFAGLHVAERAGELRGVVWARPVPGRQIQVWPPMLAPGEPNDTQHALLSSLEEHLRESGVRYAYASTKSGDDTQALIDSGFRYITDMGRLDCHLPSESTNYREPDLLEFEPYDASQVDRLKQILRRTNQDSLDCPAMRGLRHVDDVLHGHLHREDYRPAHWRIIRHRGQDAGCLLVSRHQSLEVCEVVYLGLAPEARGQGLGRITIRHAQHLARLADASVLTLGCDLNNPPALRTYLGAGFQEIDRWSVYIKTFDEASAVPR